MNTQEAEIIFQNKAITLSKEKLHFHTIQFLIEEDNAFLPYGSGVLIRIEDHYLICTAAHVTEDVPPIKLYVLTVDGVQFVRGGICNTDFRADINFDLSYILLDPTFGQLLTKTYQFLPLINISYPHIPKETANYMVSGYQGKTIWVKDGNTYTGSSHFLLSMAPEKVYKYHDLDPYKQYALSFSGKGVHLESNKKTAKIGDMRGISGCGLWTLKAIGVSGEMVLEYSLIGIMTSCKKAKYYILIANKIEFILADLERKGLVNLG